MFLTLLVRDKLDLKFSLDVRVTTDYRECKVNVRGYKHCGPASLHNTGCQGWQKP